MASWNKNETQKLINLYAKCSLLYDGDIQTARTAKEEQYNFIYKEIVKTKPNISISDIKRKIKILRDQFFREESKVLAGKKGSAKYSPKLWCYNDLKFLNSSTKAKAIIANREIKVEATSQANSGRRGRDYSGNGFVDHFSKQAMKREQSPEFVEREASPILDLEVEEIETANLEDEREINPITSTISHEVLQRPKKGTAASIVLEEARTALKFAEKLVSTRLVADSKEDIFGKFVASELKRLCEQDYDEAIWKIQEVLRQIKQNKDEVLAEFETVYDVK